MNLKITSSTLPAPATSSRPSTASSGTSKTIRVSTPQIRVTSSPDTKFVRTR